MENTNSTALASYILAWLTLFLWKMKSNPSPGGGEHAVAEGADGFALAGGGAQGFLLFRVVPAHEADAVHLGLPGTPAGVGGQEASIERVHFFSLPGAEPQGVTPPQAVRMERQVDAVDAPARIMQVEVRVQPRATVACADAHEEAEFIHIAHDQRRVRHAECQRAARQGVAPQREVGGVRPQVHVGDGGCFGKQFVVFSCLDRRLFGSQLVDDAGVHLLKLLGVAAVPQQGRVKLRFGDVVARQYRLVVGIAFLLLEAAVGRGGKHAIERVDVHQHVGHVPHVEHVLGAVGAGTGEAQQQGGQQPSIPPFRHVVSFCHPTCR